MSSQVAPWAVVVIHKVADYDRWKEMFDAHQGAREAASAVGHHLSRSIEDPNELMVYCPGTDLDRLKAFVEGEDIKTVMKDAGVVGPPTIRFVKPMEVDVVTDRNLIGAVVTHEVEDYDKWKAAFDAHEAERKGAGFLGHAVNQAVGNPNLVIVYVQAETADRITAFVGSDDVKKLMQEAGVKGPPQVSISKGIEWAEY